MKENTTSKGTPFFWHNYNARNNIKIKHLMRKHGQAGYGIYWAIIEELYENANALPLDYNSIANDLRVSSDVIQSIINDFDLFEVGKDTFSISPTVNVINYTIQK